MMRLTYTKSLLLVILAASCLLSGLNAHAQIKRGAVATQPEAMRPPPPEDEDPQPPFNAAVPISQSVQQTMTAGGTYTVSITMKNTGNTTWLGDNGYGLGSSNPTDNLTWGIGRVTVPGEIPPGGFAQFTFQVTAPSNAGSYNFQWRILREYVEWFGTASDNLVINVVAPTPDVPTPTPETPQYYGGLSPAGPSKSILPSGASLRENQYIESPNGRYKLFMQGDGSFVMYRGDGTVSYRMEKHGAYAVMQTDGNLVEYRSDGAAIWVSNTTNCPGCFLEIEDNGNLFIGYHNEDRSYAYAVWGTGPDAFPISSGTGTAGVSQMQKSLPPSPPPPFTPPFSYEEQKQVVWHNEGNF